MDEDSFKVPAKKSEEKAPAKKSAPSAVKALPAPKEKPSIEKNRIASSGRLKPGVQPNAPDMGNLTREERMAKVLGKGAVSDKSRQKTEQGERVPVDTIRKELSRTNGKKPAEEKPKSNSNTARRRKSSSSGVSIPPVGHRNSKKNTISPDIRYLLTVLVIFVCCLLLAAAIRFSTAREKSAAAVAIPSDSAVVQGEAASEVLLEIRSGMSASAVASQVAAVTDSAAFLSYLEENSLAGSLQIGTYRVPQGISAEALARALTSKEDAALVIYPGMTISEIDRLLVNRGLASSGDFVSATEALVSAEGLSFAEGWFLSGSYSFTSASSLASDMHEAMLSYLRENAGLVAASDLSVNDIVILASMINRETQDEEQMKIIAGVLLARLRIDMPLGVDATTRYELDNWNGTISQRVYDTITPYNTRRKKGLPPSGIGSPSPAAIQAVLSPYETDDLYYLHDEEGRLYTSATYEEHLETYERVH